MFSPHDSRTPEEWFRRFDAASRHLPAEERANQREEIQQHLEGLVAAKTALGQPPGAAWVSALRQFGDPTQIGRKMSQEWQQSRTGFRADMKAVLFAIGLAWLQSVVFPLCSIIWLLWMYLHGASNFNGSISQLPLTVQRTVGFIGALLIYIAIGRKYPLQAIRATLYSSLLWSLFECLLLAMVNMHNKAVSPQLLSGAIAHTLMWMPAWVFSHSVIAYLASVTKRGWYRPSLADFKLTLPRKRPQTSR